MTKPKAVSLGPSGPLVWTDDELVPNVPDLSDALQGVRVNLGEFSEWLRIPLADYRAHALARASMAQRSAVIRWLEAAAAEPEAALADGRLGRLPAWYAEPAVAHAAFKIGLDWKSLLVSGSAPDIARALLDAAAALRRQPTKRGRPSMLARDALLRAVVEKLKRVAYTNSSSLAQPEAIGVADAEELADKVLVAAAVKLVVA